MCRALCSGEERTGPGTTAAARKKAESQRSPRSWRCRAIAVHSSLCSGKERPGDGTTAATRIGAIYILHTQSPGPNLLSQLARRGPTPRNPTNRVDTRMMSLPKCAAVPSAKECIKRECGTRIPKRIFPNMQWKKSTLRRTRQ